MSGRTFSAPIAGYGRRTFGLAAGEIVKIAWTWLTTATLKFCRI